MANNLTTASIETKLLQKMDTLEKRLHESAKPDGSRASDRNLVATWGGGQREGNGWVDGWPVERLRRVAESYDSASAMHMMKGNNGRCRLSGMGPALVKMATLALGSKLTGQELPNSYDENTLERETGFITYQKARRDGRKGLSGQITKTALAEGSGQTGGYLIPPQFQNELLTIAAEDAFIEPRAKVLPMNSRTAQWPMLDITTTQATGVTPYFGGVQAQWQPEAATINEFEPAFKQSEWTAWDLVLFTLASNQILADNGIGLDALLTQLFGAAMVWFKEYAFLQGKGAGNSMPLGILNAPATYVQNRGTPATFKLADAAAMMSHLQIRSWDDACWIMHQSVIPQLIQMVDNASSNRLVWMNPVMPGQVGAAASKLPNAFLNGLPLFFTEKLPSLGTKGDVMLVDWSRYVIGQRLDVQIDVSPHFKFQNNQLAWRVVARCDGKPWLNSTIQDAAGFTVSPFICLN